RPRPDLFERLDKTDRRVAILLLPRLVRRLIPAVVHAEAGGDKRRLEAQAVVVDAGKKSPARLATPTKLHRPQPTLGLAHQQIIFDVNRVKFLLGNRIPGDRDKIVVPKLTECITTEKNEKN